MTRKWVRVTREVTIKPCKFLGTSEECIETVIDWHTERCLADQAKYEAMEAEYQKKWPNYCTHCNGWGGSWYSYDPSPAGVSLSPGSLEDFDICPHCVEEGKCPRCDSKMTEDWGEDDSEACSICGWNWGKGDDDGIPNGPECGCWCAKDHPLGWGEF